MYQVEEKVMRIQKELEQRYQQIFEEEKLKLEEQYMRKKDLKEKELKLIQIIEQEEKEMEERSTMREEDILVMLHHVAVDTTNLISRRDEETDTKDLIKQKDFNQFALILPQSRSVEVTREKETDSCFVRFCIAYPIPHTCFLFFVYFPPPSLNLHVLDITV